MDVVRVGRGRSGVDGAGGYTALELAVVLVIVAALVSVVVFSLRGINDNGRENSCRSEKRQVQAAVESFLAEEDRYPADVRELLRNPVTGRGFLDRTPRWYRSIAADGTVSDPEPSGRCAGI